MNNMTPRTLLRRRFVLIGGWLVFTVSLAIWWLIFGLRQLEAIRGLNSEHASKLVEYQTMLMVEGLSLVASLLAGGIALCWLVVREEREKSRIADFFSVFSHELKTPLTSIQLQAESLRSKLADEGGAKTASRLLEDTQRLLLQLENALMSADEKFTLVFESIDLESFFRNISLSWPSLKINVEGNGGVKADIRALTAVTQNILSNAIFHGKASVVNITILKSDEEIRIKFHDNGKGFTGDVDKIGEAYKRHYQGSGSGIGLAIVRSQLKRMDARLEIDPVSEGFSLTVIMKSYETDTTR